MAGHEAIRNPLVHGGAIIAGVAAIMSGEKLEWDQE